MQLLNKLNYQYILLLYFELFINLFTNKSRLLEKNEQNISKESNHLS